MGKLVSFDIGENSVKAVYLAGGSLKKAVTAELPDAMVRDGRILSMDAMADLLREMAKANGIPFTNAALVLSSADVFVRNVTVPVMTEQQLRFNLPYEFSDFLTEEKNKYFFDYSVQRVVKDDAGQPKELELFACAMLKERVEAYRAMFRRAGFRLRLLTPTESAIGAVLAAYTAQEGGEDDDRCIVSLGHRNTGMYIYRGGVFESRRSIETGGADLDAMIADQCGVDIHVAHGYKDSNYNGVMDADYAHDFYSRMGGEILRAVNFYNYNNRGRELRTVYLCGGGAGVPQMCEVIRDVTKLDVRPAEELLPKSLRPEQPWLYLRAIAGASEALREGMR